MAEAEEGAGEDEVGVQVAGARLGEGVQGVVAQYREAGRGIGVDLFEEVALDIPRGLEFAGEFEDFGFRLVLGTEFGAELDALQVAQDEGEGRGEVFPLMNEVLEQAVGFGFIATADCLGEAEGVRRNGAGQGFLYVTHRDGGLVACVDNQFFDFAAGDFTVRAQTGGEGGEGVGLYGDSRGVTFGFKEGCDIGRIIRKETHGEGLPVGLDEFDEGRGFLQQLGHGNNNGDIAEREGEGGFDGVGEAGDGVGAFVPGDTRDVDEAVGGGEAEGLGAVREAGGLG